MTENELAARITSLVNEALEHLQSNRCEGAINWADLSCVSVLIGTEYSGGEAARCIRVHIEEAAPESWQLSEAVSDYLTEHVDLSAYELDITCEW